MENKTEKETVSYGEIDPCQGCKYAKKRENRALFQSWHVCGKPAEERVRQIETAMANVLDACRDFVHSLQREPGAKNVPAAEIEAKGSIAALENSIASAVDFEQNGWSEPPKGSIKSCHEKHDPLMTHCSETKILCLDRELCSAFNREIAPAMLYSRSDSRKTYTSAQMGNVYDPRILYAEKDGFYTSRNDDLMDYIEIVETCGQVSKENWKTFWSGRGYKVYFCGKEMK